VKLSSTAIAATVAATAVLGLGCGSDGSETSTDGAGSTLPAPADLPEGAVAVVVDVPAEAAAPFDTAYEDCNGEEVTPDVGQITDREYECAFIQAAAAAGQKRTPRPGDPRFDQTREAAMKSLIEAAWLQAVAAEDGISVSRAEVSRELQHLKEANFKTESEYRDFVTSSHYSARDVEERIELQLLSHRLEQRARRAAKQGDPLAEEDAVRNFLSGFHRRWRARTVCAPGFEMFLCSNVKAAAESDAAGS